MTKISRTKIDNEDFIIGLVLEELHRAEVMFPAMRSFHEGIAIIREEYLELEKEIFKIGSEGSTIEDVQREALQLSAMTIRFLQDFSLCDLKQSRTLLGWEINTTKNIKENKL